MSGAVTVTNGVTEMRALAEHAAGDGRTAATNGNQAGPGAARDHRSGNPKDSEFDTVLQRAQREQCRTYDPPLGGTAHQVPPQQHEIARGKYGTGGIAPTAIDDEAIHCDRTVRLGVDAVLNAYQTGGAKAAAETLRQRTVGVSPITAERMLMASLPTIDGIAADMKRSLTEGGPIAYLDVAGVYGSIAAATDCATRGNNCIEVVSRVAVTMLRHLPSEKFQPHAYGGPAYLLPAYQEAVTQSIGSGTGASLALEIAVRLKDAGRASEANSLLSATQLGVQILQGG